MSGEDVSLPSLSCRGVPWLSASRLALLPSCPLSRRLQELLSKEELGGEKPTDLPRRMKKLLGDKYTSFDKELFLQLFYQRLPPDTQRCLFTVKNKLSVDELATLTDEFMATLPQGNNFVVAASSQQARYCNLDAPISFWLQRANFLILSALRDIEAASSLWLHRRKNFFWRHRGNDLVVSTSRHQSRCGCIVGRKLVVAASRQKSRLAASRLVVAGRAITFIVTASRQQSRLSASRQQARCGYIEETITLWLHRTNPILVAACRQQFCCGCIEPIPLLWLHHGLVNDASRQQAHCGCIEETILLWLPQGNTFFVASSRQQNHFG
ncbi:hypothetical protein O3P69_002674 [Scylla paramamosain]|uniref:Uncharacterized protein n=1 Tax=Scylla paramamosain TaxID=85552 RepID=A0AAW0ULX4_SCYPA